MTRAWTAALGLAVAMLAGVLAPGAATGGVPYVGVDVEVTVWRALDDDGDLYVGARDARGLWRRHPAALDMSATSPSGRFHRSEAVSLTVPLAGFGEVVVEAVVWRSVADPSRLHLSVRREGRGERWRTANEPLAMRAYEPTEWQRYERADPVYVEFAFFDPLPHASVAGPLAVFTAESGNAWSDADGWGVAESVYVLDTGTGKYWRAFDYWRDYPYQYWPGGVATAGDRLIAWDERQVRRVWLDGWSRTVLYEGEDIREVEVSPDGMKVAVMEEDGALTVLATATGEALLRVESQTELTALLPDAPERSFYLEGWNAASDRIAVAASREGDRHTGILTLDGALHLLPPNTSHLSPDFRHTIRPRTIAGHGYFGWAWSGFDVIESASGRTVHSVTVTRDRLVLSWRWQPDANRYAWFEMGRYVPDICGYDLRERPSEEGDVAAATTCGWSPWEVTIREAMRWEGEGETSAVGPRVLDVASGAIGQPTRDEWYGLRTEGVRLATQGSCWNYSAQTCGLFLEGRPVWNGRVEAVGVIELAEPLALFDATLLDSPRLPDPPAPPAHAEMIGPLFAWSIAGGYERTVDTAGNERFQPVRRVMVRNEGTGRSWRVLDYPLAGEIWPAHGGFVVQSGNAIRFVTPDGQARTLLVDDRIRDPDSSVSIHVSPSGGKIIASLDKWDEPDVTLVVLAPSTGEELLRIESSNPRFEEILREWRDFWDELYRAVVAPPAFAPLAWNADETAFSVAVGWRRPGAVFNLDGEFTPLSPDAEFGSPAESLAPAAERASVRCPDHADPIQWCAVLLDGEVMGEGRWADAIGFVALD